MLTAGKRLPLLHLETSNPRNPLAAWESFFFFFFFFFAGVLMQPQSSHKNPGISSLGGGGGIFHFIFNFFFL